MATSRLKRSARPVHAVAGVLVLAVPSSALALTSGAGASAKPAPAAPALSPIESLKLDTTHVAYGRHLTVSGTTSRLAAGRRVELELATEVPHSYEGWRVLSTATVNSTGGFRLSAPMQESGTIRVTGGPAVAAPKLTTRDGATGDTGLIANDTLPAIAPSAVRRVTVAPELKITGKSLGLVGGQRGFVHGYLEPGRKGRHVAVQAREHGHWRDVASTRTGRYGGFTMRFGGSSISGAPLRVDFPGDAENTPRSVAAGSATVLSPVVASWYYDAGNTACGFHAYYGVANLSLPCGTHVTISNGHTTVVATVDDRGPYVGGRVYDLNQNVAQALGFGGVGTVYTSIA